jgi:hypothetical protein
MAAKDIEKHKFPKGVSGNPKGRPKLPDLKEAIAKILSEEKDGHTALDAILAALRAKAAKGDVRAAQELLDRGFGKAKQVIDVTAEVENKQKVDLTGLTDDELRTLAEIQSKSGVSKT